MSNELVWNWELHTVFTRRYQCLSFEMPSRRQTRDIVQRPHAASVNLKDEPFLFAEKELCAIQAVSLVQNLIDFAIFQVPHESQLSSRYCCCCRKAEFVCQLFFCLKQKNMTAPGMRVRSPVFGAKTILLIYGSIPLLPEPGHEFGRCAYDFFRIGPDFVIDHYIAPSRDHRRRLRRLSCFITLT
jgi:hypothetical protein